MPSPLRICPELLNRSAVSCAECSMVCWRYAFSQVYQPFRLLDNIKSIKNIVATVGKHPLQWAITFSVAFFHYVIGLTSRINDEHFSWTRLTSLYDSCLPFHSTSTAQVAQALLHLLGLFWLSLIVQCEFPKCGLDAVIVGVSQVSMLRQLNTRTSASQSGMWEVRTRYLNSPFLIITSMLLSWSVVDISCLWM